MHEREEQEWWARILSDVHSFDTSDLWERTKVLFGIVAANNVGHITSEQADYAREVCASRAAENPLTEEDPLSDEYRTRLWQAMLDDAKSVDCEDLWERTKVVVGMTGFSTLGLISREQLVYVQTLVMGEEFDTLGE